MKIKPGICPPEKYVFLCWIWFQPNKNRKILAKKTKQMKNIIPLKYIINIHKYKTKRLGFLCASYKISLQCITQNCYKEGKNFIYVNQPHK